MGAKIVFTFIFTTVCYSFAQQKETLCSEHQKLLDCIEQSGYNRYGPNFSKYLPKSMEEFQKECEVAKNIEDCLWKNRLKEICSEDPKYKQLSGSILYMCEHPHKDEIEANMRCISEHYNHVWPFGPKSINRCVEQLGAQPAGGSALCTFTQNSLNCLRDDMMTCGAKIYNIFVTTVESGIVNFTPDCNLRRVDDSGSPVKNTTTGSSRNLRMGKLIFCVFIFIFW